MFLNQESKSVWRLFDCTASLFSGKKNSGENFKYLSEEIMKQSVRSILLSLKKITIHMIQIYDLFELTDLLDFIPIYSDKLFLF